MYKDFGTNAFVWAKKINSFLSRITLFCLLGLLAACSADSADEEEGLKGLMGRGYGMNTASVMVDNLDTARAHFSEKLGFFIPPGQMFGKETFVGTNRLSIALPDMFSLELIATVDTVEVEGKDSLVRSFLAQHDGARLFSLSTSSTDSTREWLASRGLQPDSLMPYGGGGEAPEGWGGSDGGPQATGVGLAGKYPSAYLPEFIELSRFPYNRMHEWRSFYVMQRGFLKHPNGVVGIKAIQIAVDDLSAAREEFLQMGFPEVAEDTVDNRVRFRLNTGQEIWVMTPNSPEGEMADFLRDRGAGIFGMRFEVENIDSTHNFLAGNLPADALLRDTLSDNRLTVPADHAYGVRMDFVQESEEQAVMVESLTMPYDTTLDVAARENAKGMYLKYCALCHGEDREGYAADFAPSLKSHSLLATAKSSNFLRYTIQYGRKNTAMGGYYSEQGGPLDLIEIELLMKWLYDEAGVKEPVELSREPVSGDLELGKALYAQHCTTCHGEKGEGISAPALANPMLLATATDEFLRYAIAEGRDGTPMIAYKDSLSKEEIDGLTVFLRSRASGWTAPSGDTISVPTPEEYVLNPDAKAPDFELREGMYVSAVQLEQALRDSLRLVLLDARSEVAWRQTHIPGAIPVPYYEEPEAFVNDIPKDSTMIVAYCACPHAASQRVISTLRRYGYENTAILDEGILVWAQLGFPVQHGQ